VAEAAVEAAVAVPEITTILASVAVEAALAEAAGIIIRSVSVLK
jgi:hypothetical protein